MEIDRLRVSKPTLLVGSAISQFPPTNLPTGGTVTRGIILHLFPSADGFPTWIVRQARQLPFEAIIEAHPDSTSATLRKSIAAFYAIERALTASCRRQDLNLHELMLTRPST